MLFMVCLGTKGEAGVSRIRNQNRSAKAKKIGPHIRRGKELVGNGRDQNVRDCGQTAVTNETKQLG